MSPRDAVDRCLSQPAWPLVGNREILAWLGVLGVAALSRLVDLGARAMNHDESLHAFYSFQLFNTGSYRHDPAYHGPLLYYVNALVYAVAGVGDATARLAPAVAGVALVMSLSLFRPHLGRLGAWLSAVLVVLSPTLLFYSRQLWSDVYVAVLSLLWTYGAFRYLGHPRRRWLVLVTVAMALSFLAKEVSFIFGAIIGSFFAGLAAVRILLRRESWRQSAAGDLAAVMLSLALPFAVATGHLALGWNPTDYTTATGQLRSVALAALGLAASVVLAWLWFGRMPPQGARLRFRDWLGLAGLFWLLEGAFFTSFLTNAPAGLASGIAGSLGYWLGQHPVGRGGQPWFYYLLLASLYELLPLILGLCGFVAVCRGPGEVSPGHGAAARDRDAESFPSFCAWWTAASWVAYTWAGEKMPWLLMHLVLPLCLLGGWWLARVLEKIDWDVGWSPALMIAGGVPALAWVVAGLGQDGPFAGRQLAALATTVRWMFRAMLATLIAMLVVRGFRRVGWTNGRRIAFAGLVGLAAILTVRTGIRLTYIDYDLPTELLVYAHGTPDIKAAMAEIEVASLRSTGGHDLVVAYDDASTWPFIWYLRSYRNARFYGSEPTVDAMSASIIIVGPKNADKVWPFVARGYVKRDYRLIWWPIQDYASASWSDAVRALVDPEQRQRLWRFAVYRRWPGLDLSQWPHRQGFTMYISGDLARQIWPLSPPAADGVARASSGPVPQLAWHPVEVYEGVYEGRALRAPTGVAIGPDGARIIADGGNDRVVVLNADGTFRLAFGSGCRLAAGPAGSCRDPDGSGPREIGDGQFHEPWGVAVSAAGDIYVADTWNGRIQVFDGRGGFLRRWGHFGQPPSADPAAAPLTLYGPRSLVLDSARTVLVADTGNKRLVRFSARGEPVRVVGGPGSMPGRFSEPVGVAVGAADGGIYVADTWNRRIQRLDRSFEPVAQWSVPSWEGRGVLNKPYLAVDAAGAVYASDPEGSRVLRFDAEGRLDAVIVLKALGARAVAVPVGLAIDPSGHRLFVVDRAGDRVLVFRLDTATR